MATISAVEAIPGQRTDNGENTGKTAAPKPSSPEFKRNYFITNPESRSPTEGAENPDRPDKFKFKGDTREQMRTFLDNFMAENYNARWDRGGEDLLKGRPAAEALFKLLGGEKSGGIEDNALQTKIDAVLKTPEGWVLTKSLVEEDTAIKMMTLGVLAATENPGRTTNPQDIIDQERTALAEQGNIRGRVKNVMRRDGQTRLGRHPRRTGALIGAGIGILSQSVDAIPDRITNITDFLADHHDLIENIQEFGSRITPDGTLTTAATTLAGLGLGWYAGRRRNNSETALNNAHAAAGGLQPAAEALNVIQNNPDLAKYVKRTLKIDVTGLQIDASGRIEVIDQTKVNGDIKGIMDQAKTALVVRSLYYRDLGVPPADRTIMPERSFLNNGTIQGGSPEILEQKIQARFRELGDTVDRFGNTRYLPDGVTENPLFNKRRESETPQLEAFLTDVNDNTVDSPWYGYETNPLLPDDPNFNLSEVRYKTSKTKNRYKRQGLGVKREQYVVEYVNDKWTQVEYLPPSGIKNPFWGKVDASAPPYNFNTDQIANLGRKPDNAFIEYQIKIHGWPPNTEDKWGQKPEDPGFGREDLTGRHKSGKEIGRKKTPDFDTQMIRPRADAIDRFGRGNTSIWWGTDKDMAALHEGRGLPDYNIQAIVDAADPDSLDIWGQTKLKTDGTPNPFYGRIDARLADNNARLADANMNLVPVTTDKKGVTRDMWGQTAVYTSGPLKGKENPYFRRIPESFVGPVYTTNFNENDLVDQFNQKRLNPDGTQNKFFTRLEETKLKTINLDNIDDSYKYDQFNQPLIITEGPRKGQLNIFFGRNRGLAELHTLDSLGPQVTNFNPEDLTDLQDRDFREPIFATGEHYTRNRAGRKVKIPTPARIISLAEDAAGNKSTDAAFWTDDPVPAGGFTPNYGRYNPHTGKDVDGRLPSHPLFCIDANFRQPDVATLQVDKWGQRRGTTEAFGIRGPDELAGFDAEANIQKYMDARAAVMADLARDVLVKIDKTPAGDGALLEQKLVARQDGGEYIRKQQESARTEKDLITAAVDKIKQKQEAIGARKKAQETLDTATRDLSDYLASHLGNTDYTQNPDGTTRSPEEIADAAIADLQAALQAPNHDITINGRLIPSVYDRDQALQKQKDDEEAKIYTDNKQHKGESDERWQARLNRELEKLDAKYVVLERPIERDKRKVLDATADIGKFKSDINQSQEQLKNDSDIVKAEREAITPTGQIATDAVEVLRIIRIDRLRTASIQTIMESINAEYNTDPTRGGWPVEENPAHIDAVLAAKIEANELTAVADPDTRRLIAFIRQLGLTQDEILAPAYDVTTRVNSIPGIETPFAEYEIRAVQLAVVELNRNRDAKRERIIQDLLSETEREGALADRALRNVDVADDVRNLEITIDLMKRQGEIFDKTREVLANAQSVFKVLTEDRTGARIPEEVALISHLKTDAVKDDAKEHYTPAELKTPDTTPLSYLDLLQKLTGYQDRADRNDYYEKLSIVITPPLLEQAFRAAAAPTIERTDDLTQITKKLNKNISAVTALQMHNVFLNVINTLKTKGLALP